MKKLLLIVTLAAICLSVFCAFPASAEQYDYDQALVNEAYTFVSELCALRRNEGDVRIWLTNKMQSVSPVFTQTFSYGDNKKGYNLIVKVKGADSSKKIVVGAHYDLLSGGGEGASDNACGVAALYLALKQAVKTDAVLPYDVEFVAFDAEESNLIGSSRYVELSDPSSILLMINIDTVGIGDNVYLWCENKRTDLADFILDNAALELTEKPYNKGTYAQYDAFGYGYYEFIQGSDHASFRVAGIPTAFIFAGTYSAQWGYAQSAVSEYNVFNTPQDTFDTLVKACPQFAERVAGIAQTVQTVLTADGFKAVADNARAQLINFNLWFNRWWPIIVAAVILLVFLILTFVYYRKLQKKALLGTAEAKRETVFDKPDANDIFSFDNSDKNGADNGGASDGIDDIFTFKK